MSQVQNPTKSQAVEVLRPTISVDGFEVFLHGLPLISVAPITSEEQTEIRQYANQLVAFGYASLFALTVIFPLAFQFVWRYLWRPETFFITLLLLGLCVLGLLWLPQGLRLRRPLKEIWVFGSERSPKTIEYLPDASATWREKTYNDVTRRYFRQKTVRVAMKPAQRVGGRLTESERTEIAETIRAQRAFFLPVELVPILFFGLLVFGKPEGFQWITSTTESVVLLGYLFLLVRPHRRFVRSLQGATDRVTLGDGNEFLSSGIPWTVDGTPASWRRFKPDTRIWSDALERGKSSGAANR